MAPSPTDPDDEVIEYVPKRRGTFRWSVAAVLIAAWLLVLGGVVVLKLPALRLLLPVILVVMLLYLTVCTVSLFRDKSS